MSQYLGQHFLKNKVNLRKIVEALDLKSGDTIIEIGPGHGELTDELRIKNAECRIIAIEKDRGLASELKEKFKDDKNIEIIHGDVLKLLPNFPKSHILNSKSYKVVGNIPYYITGFLFRILGELEQKPSLIVLLIQKEVAERVCTIKHSHGRIRISRLRSGSERYSHAMNLLAASVQFWAEPKIIGYVSRKDFSPQPKVDSAIIKLTPKTQNLTPKTYYSFIKILFKQPRKTILNNLEFRIKNKPLREVADGNRELRTENRQKLKEKLEKIGINPQDRPQDLSIEQIKRMSEIFPLLMLKNRL